MLCTPSPEIVTLSPCCGAPPSTTAVVPATPDRLSAVANRSVWSVRTQSTGSWTEVVGGVRSIRTAAEPTGPVRLPATSAALATAVRSVPSPPITESGTGPARPEVASDAVHRIVTSSRYQPAGFGGVVATPDRVGGVPSRLIGPTETLPVSAALSTAERVTVWFAPSWLTTTGAGQVAIPDGRSVQANVTVTGSVFQPAGPAAGCRVPVITGGIRSTRATVPALVRLPSRSLTRAVTLVPAVEVLLDTVLVTTAGATPTPASTPVKVKVTGAPNQPCAVAVMLGVMLTTGPVLSSTYEPVPGVLTAPAASVQAPVPGARAVPAWTVSNWTPSPRPAVSVKVQVRCPPTACAAATRVPPAVLTSTQTAVGSVVAVRITGMVRPAKTAPVTGLVTVPVPPVTVTPIGTGPAAWASGAPARAAAPVPATSSAASTPRSARLVLVRLG